ncbi:MAG: hypothetical protein GY842_15630 [bacterium]|nr:hypothetical protein [bacterium]
MRTTFLIVAAGIGPLLCTGCEKTKDIEFVTPDPIVPWSDLDLPEATDLDDSRILLTQGRTTGLFPAALAVARVRVEDDESSASALVMNTEPEAELLPWNSLLDDQRLVSGVFPIKPIALQGEPVTVPHVLRVAEAMHAPLCLIYSTADLSENESEVRGAIYATQGRQPLAVIHARAYIDDLEAAIAELPEPAPWNPEYFHAAKDSRYHDPAGMAIYKFETQVRAAVIALRKNDTPHQNLPTEGWIPEKTADALLWPPQSGRP